MKNILKSKYYILKQKAYITIYGTSTIAGKMFDIILLIFILISSFLVMLESIQDVDKHLHLLLVVLEWIITIFFSLEYALRVISNPKRKQYIFSFYGIIDLISILPMYLSFFFVESKFLSIIRILRLLRIFRILDLAQFNHQANELRTALYASKTKIMVFIYFVLVICILLGALMYMIEPHNEAFTSIPRSIYWCVVTLTTVGYGDVVPTTTLGQIMASAIMILGYMPDIASNKLPILTIAKNQNNPFLLYSYSIVLYCAFVSTGVGVVFGLVARFENAILSNMDIGKRRALISFSCLLISVIFSLVGLTKLVAVGYGWIGRVCIFLLVIPLAIIAPIKNAKFKREHPEIK